MEVLTCKPEEHSNCEGGCQTKVYLLRRNLRRDLLILIKLKFLRILNSSQSFQEPVMTCPSCNYTTWEKKKSWIQLHLNLFQYLSLHNLIWFMTSYTMRQTCVPLKVRSGTNLRGVQRFPEFFASDTGFRVPETLIFIAKSTCRMGKLVFARF